MITYLSIFIGNFIQVIFPKLLTRFIGSLVLVLMGLYIFLQASKEKSNGFNVFNNPISSDFDNSKIIDSKESMFLALALSLDSLCIGIGGSIIDINLRLFPLFVSIFQILFLSLGAYFGIHISKICKLPQNIWSIISGISLILIGIVKFF